MFEGFRITKGPEQKREVSSSPEQLQEALLTPEAIEKIMQKVQDINEPGLAFSRINNDSFQKILQEGLLGTDFRKSGGGYAGEDEPKDKEGWRRNARSRSAIIHLNIVGRENKYSQRKDKRAVHGTTIGSSYYSHPGAIFVVFNLSKFKEVETSNRREDWGNPPNKSYKFEPNSYLVAREKDNEIGQDVWDEHGFLLSSRVAPRFFQGVVFYSERKYNNDDIYNFVKSERSPRGQQEIRIFYERQIDEDKVKKQVTDLIQLQMQVDAGKPELLNPIYDTEGNLWWPKRMSHEEVKKFASERSIEKDIGESEEPVA